MNPNWLTNATAEAEDYYRRLSIKMRDEAREKHGADSGYWTCYHTCEHFGLDGGVMACNHPDAPHRMIVNHTELEQGRPESCPVGAECRSRKRGPERRG